MLLEVNHLSKSFNAVNAVSDLSFSINEGDVYGFLGQNGAGKSTTIRMLLTLIKPDSGSIQIFDKSLPAHRHEILQNIGAVIERPDLYKYLSAYDNLSIFARLSGIRVSRNLIMDQLDRVGLAERSKSKVHTYSQGMKQRLGIAIALVHNPKLVILDEPTNGLDPQGIADMRKLIQNLSKEQGKTVLVSSHLLSEIEQVATRMIIIHKGKKIIEGAVKELLNPADTIVEIDTTDNIKAAQLLPSSGWNTFSVSEAGTIKITMNKNNIPALSAWLMQGGLGIMSVRPMHSLEDYFLSLTTPQTHVDAPAN